MGPPHSTVGLPGWQAHRIFLQDFMEEVTYTESRSAQSGLWIHSLRFHNPDCAGSSCGYVVISLGAERRWSSG